MRFSRHLAAALLLAAPGLALAQNVPFQTLGRGAMGPFGAAENKVIRSAQELQASGLEQYFDPAALIAPIDWQNEMVVACLLGTKNTGGYGIEIQSLEVQILTPTPLPGPPHPPPLGIPYLVVNYRASSPPPGAFVPQVITAPYHLVRVRSFPRVTFSALPAPSADPFEQASLSYETGPIGGTGDNLLIEVSKSGQAVALRSSTTAHYMPVHGQASASQLAALTAAVQNARAGSLPASIPPGVVFVVQPPSFSLSVTSGRPQLAGNTGGVLGFYGAHEARVRPLVDALKAIGDSLLSGTQAQEFTGRVDLPPGGAVRLSSGGNSYRLAPPATASELAQFRGRTVRVRGTLQPGPQGDVILEVAEVLSPEHRPLSGRVELVAGRLEVVQYSGVALSHLVRVRAHGPAASVLRAAVGRQVSCDAWVFSDSNGAATDARVDSVEGSMKRRSRLFQGGAIVGIALKDEGIHVLAISGAFARIKAQAGIGWVQRDRIEIGRPWIPPPSPVPLATSGNTGMVNLLPGN